MTVSFTYVPDGSSDAPRFIRPFVLAARDSDSPVSAANIDAMTDLVEHLTKLDETDRMTFAVDLARSAATLAGAILLAANVRDEDAVDLLLKILPDR